MLGYGIYNKNKIKDLEVRVGELEQHILSSKRTLAGVVKYLDIYPAEVHEFNGITFKPISKKGRMFTNYK
jgi:hypothetical protein